MAVQLLKGVKVVELASFIAAATAGRFLADQGAEVVKIEAKRGDPLRFTAPTEGRPLDAYENTTWDLENANKRCISIDTRTEAGKKILFELLDEADIFITNFRTRSLAKQGLDYDSLSKRYPKLVYGIVTGYGEHGPDRDLPGFDFTGFYARGGYLESMRQRTERPFNPIPGSGDHNVGMNLAAGLLAALWNADKTGKGDKVETSLFETAIYNMGMLIQAAQYPEHGVNYPIDVREAANVLIAAWPTSDGRYIQTCMPDFNHYFASFMRAIGLDELVDDERYFPIKNLVANGKGPDLYDRITQVFSTRPAREWLDILSEHDIPHGIAANFAEILEDPQAWENDCFRTVSYPKGDKVLVNGPVRFQQAGKPDYRLGGTIGAATRDVLRDLGYAESQIDELFASGVAYSFLEAETKARD